MEKWSQQEKRETKQKQQEKKNTVKNVTVPPETVMHLYQLYGTNYSSNLKPVSEDASQEETSPKEPKKDIKKITAELADIEFDD